MLRGAFRAGSMAYKAARKASFKLPTSIRTKARMRQAQSRTMTKTMTKRKVANVKQDGTGTSRSFCYYGRRKPTKLGKMVRFITSPQWDERVTSLVLSGATGSQAWGSFSSILNGNDIYNMQNTIQNSITQGATGLLIPKLGVGQVSQKIYLVSADFYLQLTNVTNANMTVDLYDCVAKRDRTVTQSPSSDWNFGQSIDETGGISSGTTAAPSAPYSKPFSSEAFNKFWTVVRTTHVDLAQGRTHEHVHHHSLNRIVDTALFETGGSSNYTLKGITSYVMIVARGTPCETDQNSGSVTLTSARLACVSRTRLSARLLTTASTHYYENSALPTTISAVNPTVISEGSGLGQIFATV